MWQNEYFGFAIFLCFLPRHGITSQPTHPPTLKTSNQIICGNVNMDGASYLFWFFHILWHSSCQGVLFKHNWTFKIKYVIVRVGIGSVTKSIYNTKLLKKLGGLDFAFTCVHYACRILGTMYRTNSRKSSRYREKRLTLSEVVGWVKNIMSVWRFASSLGYGLVPLHIQPTRWEGYSF